MSKFGDNIAVISRAQGRRYSYDELDRVSNRLARGLRELGVQKGERVAVSLGNNLEFAAVSYTLLKLTNVEEKLTTNSHGRQLTLYSNLARF